MKLLVAASVAALALAGASVAFASSSTGNDNPDLLVSVSMVSSGTDPEVATAGDTIQVDYSVTNVSAQSEWVRFIEVDGGIPKQKDVSELKLLDAGKTLHWSKNVKVKDNLASGIYTIDVYGLSTTSIDPSFAEATITVDNG
jgi:hypothetical protein